jgi:hypothetical protein
VLSLAYALDADRSASFTEHCANFGLAPTELPIAVAVDDDGASRVAGAVVAIHSLAVVLDDHAGRWFTTSQEQSQGRGQLDLVRTSSPGGVAANLLGRFGVRAPIKTFDLDDTEHKEWTETLHGGWCEADPRFLGVPFQAISLDAESCYPLVARHLGWWDLLCAESIERHTITGEFERLCQSAVVDPTVALDPATWRRFGVTLVQCIPDGEPFPIEIKDVHRPDGRMEVVPVFSPEGWSLLFPWPDVLAAAMRSRRVPNIVRAIHYAPVGRQTGIQPRLSVLPGLELAGHCDPVLDLVQHRHVLKVRGERVLAGEVRVVLNSLVYGILSRFDETHSRQGRRWILDERPGPWICVPIASSVAAGARLLLGTLDRLVTDRGSAIAYRDTDSSLIPSSPGGGELRLADGSTIRELSWFEVEEILALFDRLSPAPWWPVW